MCAVFTLYRQADHDMFDIVMDAPSCQLTNGSTCLFKPQRISFYDYLNTAAVEDTVRYSIGLLLIKLQESSNTA